jgi:hypothetical protein
MPRHAGFVATLAAGVCLLGVSLHGITNVDHELKLAAATPAPVQGHPELVRDTSRGRDCDKHGRQHHGPEV